LSFPLDDDDDDDVRSLDHCYVYVDDAAIAVVVVMETGRPVGWLATNQATNYPVGKVKVSRPSPSFARYYYLFIMFLLFRVDQKSKLQTACVCW